MRTVNYTKSSGEFSVLFLSDGEIYSGTINIDNKSINNETSMAKNVMNHEAGEYFNITNGKNGVYTEKCQLLQKNINIVYDTQNIYENRENNCHNIRSEKQLNDRDIYFLYRYKSSEYQIPYTESNLIIQGLKQGKLQEYRNLINDFIRYVVFEFELNNKDYVLCGVPSHYESNINRNSIAYMIREIYYKYGFIDGSNYLIRYKTIEAQKNVGKRYKETHLNSIKMNDRANVKGKTVILIDDITTSGSSLNACRQILLNAGAKEVISFAFAKTSNP